MQQPVIEVKNLSIQYNTRQGNVRAVNDVSFSLQKGQTIGLVGETGAGKTTTALGILRLIPQPPGEIVSGEVLFEGQDLRKHSALQMRKIRGKQISMIFQDPMTALNPIMTVGNQIAEVIRLHEHISAAQAARKAQEILELVGIPGDRFGEYPHQFSGGMKQRVVIAIALACNPALLIADEPTTALDVTIQAQVLEMMMTLKKELGTSMILITHDLGVVAEVCDRVAIMYAGEIIESGTVQDIFKNAKHPYTWGLFGSIPNLKEDKERLTPIAGLMPDPTALPIGCAFSERCPQKMPHCAEQKAPAVCFGATHEVRCLLYTPGRREEAAQ